MNKFLLIAGLCVTGTAMAWAQDVAGEGAARSPAAAVQAQWQLTVDVIKSKVQALMEQNNGLSSEHESILGQDRKLRQSIDRQVNDNEVLRRFLSERRGRTDQQFRIAELEANLKDKRARLPALEQAAREARKQADAWLRKVDDLRIKVSDLELSESSRRAAARSSAYRAAVDRELDSLRRLLEQQKGAEAVLEKKLSSLDTQAVDPEIKMLEDKVTLLRHQKAKLMRINGQKNASVAGAHERYASMVRRKLELEAEVRSFDNQARALKDPTAHGLSWVIEKKQLVRDVVKADARNKKMREQVNNLREDIAVLRDQIASRQKLVSYGGNLTNVR